MSAHGARPEVSTQRSDWPLVARGGHCAFLGTLLRHVARNRIVLAGWGAEYPAMLSALHTSFLFLLLEGANALHLATVNSCGTSGWPVDGDQHRAKHRRPRRRGSYKESHGRND